MFTGIVETVGKIKSIKRHDSNVTLEISSKISKLLKVDQSVLHNGTCLTVESKNAQTHKVTLVQETLEKTQFKNVLVGDLINLERAMKLNSRLDGHLVSGHIDTTIPVLRIQEMGGSHRICFGIKSSHRKFLIEKGSICINGVSLTIFDLKAGSFCVAIIPYTWQHTQLSSLREGNMVNVEFDMIGKYILGKSSQR